MTDAQALAMRQCSQGSLSGEMSFPEVIARLMAAGVERYHTDYSRQEKTYYLVNGESLVVPLPHEPNPTAAEFSAPEVIAAVQQSQRNEHSYTDFIRKTRAAGCVGYFVQITGRQAQYLGRQGELHVEHFPPPPQDKAN